MLSTGTLRTKELKDAVVQDPPMTAMSDFQMKRREHPGCKTRNNRLCPGGTFLEAVESELLRRAPLPHCLFDSAVRAYVR